MRKALLSFLLAGAMTFGCSSLVMGEETTIDIDEVMSQLQDVEVTEETYSGMAISWDDIAEIANAEEIVSQGSFVEEESLGIIFFVPDFMDEVELNDADKEDGFLRFFWSDDDVSFTIQVTDAGEMKNDIDLLKELEALGDFDPMLLTVNGIDSVFYFINSQDEETQDMMAIAYIPENTDALVTFSYSPADPESEYADYFRVMMASIQRIEEE